MQTNKWPEGNDSPLYWFPNFIPKSFLVRKRPMTCVLAFDSVLFNSLYINLNNWSNNTAFFCQNLQNVESWINLKLLSDVFQACWRHLGMSLKSFLDLFVFFLFKPLCCTAVTGIIRRQLKKQQPSQKKSNSPLPRESYFTVDCTTKRSTTQIWILRRQMRKNYCQIYTDT